MKSDPHPITLAEVVGRAVEICDPAGGDEALARLLERFEDDDEPVAGVLEDLEPRLADAIESADVELDDPAVAVAAAVIQYLARQRDELDADADHIMRLAVRAEWRGDPPMSVDSWLADRGVDA